MASSSAPEAAAAGLASIMSGDQLKALMAQEGPVVKAVVLEADGTAVEMSLDMSPKVNKVAEVLGGAATILGQWPQLDVVVLKLRTAGSDATPNTHKLQPPLHAANGTLKGRLVCVRMSDESEPLDFALEEYTEFAAKTIDPADFDVPDEVAVQAPEDGADMPRSPPQPPHSTDTPPRQPSESEDDEDEDEDEEGSGSDEDDGDYGSDDASEEDDGEEEEEGAADKAALLESIVAKFMEQHERPPTVDEIKDVLRQMAAAPTGGAKRGREEAGAAAAESPAKKPAA